MNLKAVLADRTTPRVQPKDLSLAAVTFSTLHSHQYSVAQ
jgi:hypothetical protein